MVYGVGLVSGWTGPCACSASEWQLIINLINLVKPTTSMCSSQSLPDWGVCVSSLVCAMGLSTVPACQHARSVPACQRVIPEVFELTWMNQRALDVLKAKTWCHCARWLKTHKTVLMVQFLLEMMIFVLFYLSCDGLLAVGIVKVCAVYLDCWFSLDKY